MRLGGLVTEREEVRRTPAGIAVLSFRIAHQSLAMEAGIQRQVELEMPCVVLGPLAMRAAALTVGSRVGLQGFLASRGHRSRTPVLHVTGLDSPA